MLLNIFLLQKDVISMGFAAGDIPGGEISGFRRNSGSFSVI
jgi:hypothetical protein